MLNSIYAFTGPIHPYFNRVPAGMVVGALALGLAGWLLRRSDMARAARYCMILALIFLVPAALTGYLDWHHYYAGAWLVSVTRKIIMTGVLLVLMVLGIILSRRPESKGALAVYFLCFLAMLLQIYLGAQLLLGGKYPGRSEALQAGAWIFDANCRGCHPSGGNVVNPSQPLTGAPQLENFDNFLKFVRGHQGAMPQIPETMISDRHMQELYLYIVNTFQRSPENK